MYGKLHTVGGHGLIRTSRSSKHGKLTQRTEAIKLINLQI